MTDLARLAISIESDGATRATRDLRGLEGQADRTERATDKLGKGSRDAGQGIKAAGDQSTSTAQNFGRLATAAAGVTAALGATVSMAQSFRSALDLDSAIGELSTLLPGATAEIERMTEAGREMARQQRGQLADS